MERREEAIELLDRIQPREQLPKRDTRAGLGKGKGDLWLDMGDFAHAAECYSELLSSHDCEARITGYLSLANAHFERGHSDQAVDSVRSAMNEWYTEPDLIPFYGICVYGDEGMLERYGEGEISLICETFLRPGERDRIDDVTFGRLAWFLYTAPETNSAKLRERLGDNQVCELARWALEFAPDLRYSQHPQSDYLLDEDYLEGLRHDLLYGVWRASHESEDDRAYEFQPLMSADNLDELSVEDRRRAHNIVMAVVAAHGDEQTAIAVFQPFYTRVWRDRLVAWALTAEMRQLTKALVDLIPSSQDARFEEAYAAATAGDEDAEQLYRAILDQWPENTAAMNNLAVLLGSKGIQAIALFERAHQVDPSDDLYRKNFESKRNFIARKGAEEKRRETFQ